jgi:hypothetical protein
MASRARVAGIITLVSLIIPWDLSYGSGFFNYDWTIFGYDLSSQYVGFYYFLQYRFIDGILSALSFVILIIAAILLLAKPSLPKLGASMVLAGVVISSIEFAYQELTSPFAFIPMGLFLAFVAAIVGLTAKRLIYIPASSATVETDYLDKLIKLKELLDSGAITREEFEEQKRIILRSGEQ